jgi:hypothetical protein
MGKMFMHRHADLVSSRIVFNRYPSYSTDPEMMLLFPLHAQVNQVIHFQLWHGERKRAFAARYV